MHVGYVTAAPFVRLCTRSHLCCRDTRASFLGMPCCPGPEALCDPVRPGYIEPDFAAQPLHHPQRPVQLAKPLPYIQRPIDESLAFGGHVGPGPVLSRYPRWG